jgi:hypothetical protein
MGIPAYVWKVPVSNIGLETAYALVYRGIPQSLDLNSRIGF